MVLLTKGLVRRFGIVYCMFIDAVCEVPICFQQYFCLSHFVYKLCVEK